MKFLMIFFIGCTQIPDTECRTADFYAKRVANYSQGSDCDYDLVYRDTYDVMYEFMGCSNDVITPHTDKVSCLILPMIIQKVGHNYLEKWECKDSKINIGEFLKFALKCN